MPLPHNSAGSGAHTETHTQPAARRKDALTTFCHGRRLRLCEEGGGGGGRNRAASTSSSPSPPLPAPPFELSPPTKKRKLQLHFLLFRPFSSKVKPEPFLQRGENPSLSSITFAFSPSPLLLPPTLPFLYLFFFLLLLLRTSISPSFPFPLPDLTSEQNL